MKTQRQTIQLAAALPAILIVSALGSGRAAAQSAITEIINATGDGAAQARRARPTGQRPSARYAAVLHDLKQRQAAQRTIRLDLGALVRQAQTGGSLLLRRYTNVADRGTHGSIRWKSRDP